MTEEFLKDLFLADYTPTETLLRNHGLTFQLSCRASAHPLKLSRACFEHNNGNSGDPRFHHTLHSWIFQQNC